MGTPNYWVSTTGDATAAASWSQAHVPTAGEHAIVDGRSQVSIAINCAAGGAGPDEFIVTDEYYGDIGGPGNYFNNLATNTDKIIIRGHGNYYLNPTKAGYTIIDTPEGQTYLGGSWVQALHVKRGRVSLGATTSFRSGVSVITYGESAYVTIPASTASSWPAHFICYGGTIVNKDNGDTTGINLRILVAGGRFRQEGLLYSGTKVLVTAGVFEYPIATDPSAQSLVLYAPGGIVDFREAEFPIPFTTLHIGPQAVLYGSAIEELREYTWLDLGQDYP